VNVTERAEGRRGGRRGEIGAGMEHGRERDGIALTGIYEW